MLLALVRGVGMGGGDGTPYSASSPIKTLRFTMAYETVLKFEMSYQPTLYFELSHEPTLYFTMGD